MKKSSSERRTLYHLRNALHRTAVPVHPADNMKAAEDFLLVVLHSYIVAAAKAVQSNFDAVDVKALSKEIVKSFVNITISSRQQSTSATRNSKKKSSAVATDRICLYSMEVLTLGLLWHNFHNSIKEGDGDRIVRNWKFNLIAFKAAK